MGLGSEEEMEARSEEQRQGRRRGDARRAERKEGRRELREGWITRIDPGCDCAEKAVGLG